MSQRDWNTRNADVEKHQRAVQNTDISSTQARTLVIQKVIEEVAKNTQAPVDIVEFCALAAISVATQQLIKVRLPVIGERITSLMLMVIAKSGERKSTVESKFFDTIRAFETDKRTAYEKTHTDWKAKHKIWQTELRAINKLLEKAISKNQTQEEIDAIRTRYTQTLSQEPQEPLAAKILYDDSTAEALYLGLKNYLPFSGLVSSEGGSILKSRAFNDTAKLNSLWSGERITIDRAGSGSLYLDNARLTVLIMVQPEVLEKYLSKKGDQAHGSGLMARFLFSSGESTQGTRLMDSGDQKSNFLNVYNIRIRQFLDESYQSVTAQSFEPEVLILSEESAKLWEEFYNETEMEIKEGGEYEQFGDHASKLAEQAGRIAAILHKFEKRYGEIAPDIMVKAISICKDYSNNFLNLFDLPSQEIMDAKKLLEWIIQHEYQYYNCEIQKNDILQLGPKKLREKARLNKAIDVLYQDRKINILKDRRTIYITRIPE